MKPVTLTLHDPTAEVKISADASSFGLRAVLLQREGEDWKPVAYASKSLKPTEGRYTQIEESLAITWACGKFRTMYWDESSQSKLIINPSFFS